MLFSNLIMPSNIISQAGRTLHCIHLIRKSPDLERLQYRIKCPIDQNKAMSEGYMLLSVVSDISDRETSSSHKKKTKKHFLSTTFPFISIIHVVKILPGKQKS